MNARLAVVAVCAGLLALGRAAPARADADSILVRVGGELAGRQYETIRVPITADLSGAPGRALGSYTATLGFNPAQLEFEGADNGDFAAPEVNAAHWADSGVAHLTAVLPSGASGLVVLFYARFYVLSDAGQSAVTISFSEMSATATSVTPFESLLPLLRTVNATFCKSLGRWGDVDGDGQSNSFDALVALSDVVGIAVAAPLDPSLADVDADGRVTSRDALIILSYSVGLPVTGYRVLLDAPGACGTGSPVTVVITPDSLELQVGQTAPVVFAALDSLGRGAAADTVAVTSSDAAIAAWVASEGGGTVQARAPGVAILTARLGPGVAATFKVVVLARRTRWFVDVLRARLAPVQLGDSALPFEFIGDALGFAHNGDTVSVAAGTYEEEIGASVAVTILGDPANRPVIDPRGAPSWDPYYDALQLTPGAGRIVLSDLVLRAGTAFLAAHDITVRNLRIEGVGPSNAWGLELETAPYNGEAPPARAAGPQRSNLPVEPGNVLVDGVVVLGDSMTSGIVVDLADTAVVRNSSVRRTHQGQNPSCTAGAGIIVQQASVSLAQRDTVVDPECKGIALYDGSDYSLVTDLSRVTASRNVVSGAPGIGIALGSRLVSSDHNQIDNTGMVPGMRSNGASAGLYATYYDVPPDTVWSLGDVITSSGGRGFAIDTAAKGVIDSLVVVGAGQDGSYYGNGVGLGPGGTYWLSHSRITNVARADGVFFTGDHTNLHTLGNFIFGAAYNGLSDNDNIEAAPPARPVGLSSAGAAGPERAGPYPGGPDTLISVGDTIKDVGDNGLTLYKGVYALLDGLVVDSVGYEGVDAESFGRAILQNSKISRTYDAALYLYSVDSVTITRDSLVNNAWNAIYLETTVDSARLYGVVADASARTGLAAFGPGNVSVDSSVLSNSGYAGIELGGVGGRVQRSRIESNVYGVLVDYYCCSYDSIVVQQSAIQGNTTAGANNNAVGYAILDARSNYWGNGTGPACSQEPSPVCGNLGTGDAIQTTNVLYDPWLATAPVTPAPPARLLAGARRIGSPAIQAPSARPVGVTRGRAALRPGIPARPSRTLAPVPRAAPQHQHAVASHPPSKARTHAVQVLVRKRS